MFKVVGWSYQCCREIHLSLPTTESAMAFISDLVIAGSKEAEAISLSSRPANSWPTLEGKGVDPIKLATLYCAATNTAYSSSVVGEFPLVGENKNEGRWVLEFSSKVLSAIASIQDRDVASIASVWASTEELEMDRWSVEFSAQFIMDLTAHAKRAQSEGSSLFLRISA